MSQTPRFRPVQTRRAFEDVVDQIRNELARGALRSGDRLPSERELAEHFKVSRNTLREALRSLEMTGIVELRKGARGGSFIRTADGEAIAGSFADLFKIGLITPAHLTEARILIATAVTRLACRRRTEQDLEALRRNLEQTEAAVRANDPRARAKETLEFHRLLARATRNPVLIVVTDAVIRIVEELTETIGLAPNRRVMPSRRRLLQHLSDGSEDKAVEEMEANLRSLQSFYLGTSASARTAQRRARSRRPPASDEGGELTPA